MVRRHADRPRTWPWALPAGVLGVVPGAAVPLLTLAANRLLAPSTGGTVERVASSAPARVLLLFVLTGSVTEDVRFRAYPLERLRRLTGRWWPRARISLAAFGAFHLQGWNLGHVGGVVLPLGAVMTGLYLWRRNLACVSITQALLDLPIVLIAVGRVPPM